MSTNNQIQKVTAGEPPVVQLLQRMGPEIARALPRHLSPDRMARVALTALRTTPRLLECSPASVLGAIMSAAQLGLEPNTPLGLCYLIPYKRECQLIVGYQGYLELARRSGLVSAPQAHAVREGDVFEYALGLAPYLRHVPSDLADREQRPITHVYAVAHQLPQGSAPPIFVVLSAAQVAARKARSMAVRAGRSTPWDTDPEAMSLKTAIRALWRWLPKTAEMAQAAELDGVAERGGGQSVAWSSVAHEALSAAGVAVEPEPEPEIDETTGEVVEAPAAEGASASDRLAAKLRGAS